MQFGLSALLATVTAAAAVSAQISSGYILTAVPDKNGPPFNSLWTTVSFYEGGLWIGDAKTDYSSEPFIFAKGTTGSSSISFTSWHGVPTGWQNMWVYPNDMKPPGFTSPHSAFIPPGADAFNFTIGTNKRFRYKNTNRWFACPNAAKPKYYQIIYVGGSNKAPKECTAVALNVTPYGTCAA
ncbi:hypothetical protein L211DRAFT_794326 [Terfezia boudieri ATCC MYA-4762]|uniref:Uncharacterized protein n=1 Tax=Terfezia boudieri ATCC MYA-4762 TaxID=1051890 RepID=A0A3N4L9R5_9PEZI|nr:hypothetical protein L211DRAFT_794326 [Terfezia boudieri ATCC MYA-4762]